MVVVLFTVELRDPSLRAEHHEMVVRMRELAEVTPGFTEWHDCSSADSDTSLGVIVFESEEALGAWREHPDHLAIHRQGEESVYRRFRVRVFELVRDASWEWAGEAAVS